MDLEQTATDPPIAYEWYLTGPQGARFILYPITGVHTNDDVKAANKWLRHNNDVVSLQTRWVKPEDKTAPPMKIPDHVMIKELRKQIGGLEAHVHELEDTHATEVKALKTQILALEQGQDKKLRKEILTEDTYKAVVSANSKLKQEVLALRKNVSELIIRINQPSSSQPSESKDV